MVLFCAITAVSWLWIFAMSLDLYGPMNGLSMWMMVARWDATHALLTWMMWAVMMAGMMLPSASRVLLLYGALMPSMPPAPRVAAVSLNVMMFAGGYLAVWMLFSVAATAVQWWLATRSLISPMMEVTTPIGAIVLFLAGVYQFTPLKRACLRVCHAPLRSLVRRCRDGSPTFVIGVWHGLSCVGCCAALMLLLFVGGVMNLVVIAALTAFIAFEKLAGWRGRVPHVAGGLLILSSVWMLAGHPPAFQNASILTLSVASADSYRPYVIGGVLLITAQVGLIAILLEERVRRRRAAEKARRNAERYRSVVDTQSELICRYLPDTTLTFVNDAYCRFWNRTRDELLGRKFIELIPMQARDAVLERIVTLRNGMDSVEHEVTLADATVGWQHWTNQAILDADGDLVELQGVGRDVTDQRRAEGAIRTLEARNSAMLRALPDLMFVLLTDGTYVDYHAKDPSLLYIPASVFIGKKIRDIMPPDLADVFMIALDRSSRTDEPVVIEYELTLHSGLRQFETRFVRTGDDRVLSIVRDVTDWKRAIERNRDLAGRLIASQEAERHRIARELHDDVSQKLALLSMSLDRLGASDVSGPESFRELRAQIVEIASDLHNLSHELHPSKLQALGLVESLRSLCREVAKQSGVHIAFADENVPSALDPDVALCLYRIVQEALHNVARHSGARQAAVRLRLEHDALVLQVTDSGAGFDPEGADRGGLGLVSMRERAALLNGQLELHAVPGRGTRIVVRLPLNPIIKAPHAISKSA
jgi:PAS domain S-box-containing protein